MSEKTELFETEPALSSPMDHADLLAHARKQADEHGFDDMLIVDADYHHSEYPVWAELLDYIDDEVVRHFLRAGGKNDLWIPELPDLGRIQDVAGRIHTEGSYEVTYPGLKGAERDVKLAREAMDAMSLDYIAFFPGYMLSLGLIRYDLEVHLARAWGRWVVERLLPEDRRIITLLPLPLSDPEVCLQMVEEHAGTPGVAGFMVTSTRHEPLYAKQYARLFRAIEESGSTLGFHPSVTSQWPPFSQFNRYISIHAVAFPTFNIVQATNWIFNGMPERYPSLKVVFIEAGLAWVPFLMDRLDHDFNMRHSEAPLLQKRPSEYLRENIYYTSQPLESTNLRSLEYTMERINAETQLLYASDWPHWDWDPPLRIWNLPFLSEQAKRNILGLNAQRVFGLEDRTVPSSGPATRK